MLTREEVKRLKKFQKKLKYKFHKIFYLYHALSHSSYVNEQPENNLRNNETLEFLGDSVLSLVVTDYLYRSFPELSEGKLSIIRSALVSEPALAQIAQGLCVGQYMLLGRGGDNNLSRKSSSLLSDTLEALIAAVYMDGGIKKAQKFVLNIYEAKFKEIPSIQLNGSYKNRLQQYTQSKFACMPVYKIISEYGPSHKRIYEIAVDFQGHVYGYGKGSSKKKAEQEAAKNTLIKFGLE